MRKRGDAYGLRRNDDARGDRHGIYELFTWGGVYM